MPRLACLAVPLFPLAARLRCEPELRGEPLAVCEGNGPAARIVAATRPARRAGVVAGQTLAQARALVPKLVARGRDGEAERAAQAALVEAAERVSPRVEDAEPGVVYVDLAGLGRQGGDEATLGEALRRAAAAVGLPAGVGIAASKLAARVAASLPDPPQVVATGEEARFLAPLPLGRLAPSPELATTLERWGIRTIGDFAGLPAAEIASRLGAAGAALHATARGVDPRPLLPRELPPALAEGMALEWPLVAVEPFLFLARAALDRLVARLEARGWGCRRLELSLVLDPDGCAARGIDLPAPTRDVKTLLTLVRLDLEGNPPGAAVTGFTFTAHPGDPGAAQLALFGPAALSPDRLATTLARLFALLGPDRVGSPLPADDHRPEGCRLVPFAPPPPPRETPLPTRSRGLLAVRVLRPAIPVEVEVGERDGRPRRVTARVDEATARRPRIEGEVRVASGPWTVEDAWWSDAAAIEREYWDLELAGGGIVRLYRDARDGEWHADGLYD